MSESTIPGIPPVTTAMFGTKSPPKDETADALRVEQVDRDAAADFIIGGRAAIPTPTAREVQDVRAGKSDRHHVVQAFARHRIAARADLPAERQSDGGAA